MEEAISCYTQLDKTSRSIRLLVLSPELHTPDNRIQCKLIVTSIDERPIYEALSYTWGEPDSFGFKIWVNNVLVPIRRNLLCSLRVLRGQKDRILWIDALCINQNDGGERTHQVGIMRSIYRQARQVVVWLGTPTKTELDNSGLDVNPDHPHSTSIPAFFLLEEFFSGATTSAQDKKRRWMTNLVKTPELNNSDFASHWQQLAHICQFEYWQRLWIIQEICSASRAILLYGTSEVNWEFFCKLRYSIGVAAPEKEALQGIASRCVISIRESQPWTLAGPYMRDTTTAKSLEDLIKISKDCLCVDKRDKIYGLLGLTSDGSEKTVVVDYSRSLFDLYEAVIMFQRTMLAVRRLSPEKIVGFSHLLQNALLFPFDSAHLKLGMESEKRTRTLGPADLKLFQIRGSILGEILSETSVTKEKQMEKNSLAGMVLPTNNSCVPRGEESLLIPSPSLTPTLQHNLQDTWAENRFTFANFEILRTTRAEATNSREPADLEDPDKISSWSQGLNIFYTRDRDMGIGIMPKGVRNGDLLCQFQTDVVEPRAIQAIIRPHISGNLCIGRAILINESSKASYDSWPLAEVPDTPLSTFHVRRGEKTSGAIVTLNIDICMLQALTCPLSSGVLATE